jgi:hypothetical protein
MLTELLQQRRCMKDGCVQKSEKVARRKGDGNNKWSTEARG